MRTSIRGALAVVVGLCLAGGAWAEENTVSVTGMGELKQKADVAYVTLYVRADGILMADTVKSADQKVGEVKKALEERFKEIKSIEVRDTVIGEAQNNFISSDQACQPPRPEIIRRLRITLPPTPGQVYEVVDTAIRAGALMQIPSSITYSGDVRGVVVYGLLESSQLEAQVREAAMADAKKSAEELATLAGKTVGDVVRLGSGDSTGCVFPMHMMNGEDCPAPHLSLDSNEVTVSWTLPVTFELKNK